jgi:hypothetical protein
VADSARVACLSLTSRQVYALFRMLSSGPEHTHVTWRDLTDLHQGMGRLVHDSTPPDWVDAIEDNFAFQLMQRCATSPRYVGSDGDPPARPPACATARKGPSPSLSTVVVTAA